MRKFQKISTSGSLRHGSIGELDDAFLKITNYEGTVKELDRYYGIVKRQILKFQSPTTGLFPALSSDTKVASIRDSIYCAVAVWSLHQAYKRIDDDRGKSYELGQSAVKCMRGVLQFWMKQAERVELFKRNQCNKFSLHCKSDLATGCAIIDENEYFHLQIDVVSLYLLYLVQMISSNLQIIYTVHEITFIQNLVYYVERSYRTPDYGMWERGSKYNNGTPEIHASSIGMTKAALEAINGFDLFNEKGAAWSVIYVDIDAHNRDRSIFETLLPRESSSKYTDVALMFTVSFPAFATHEETLYDATKAKVLRKLKGNYGFKRFLRDGYKTELEEQRRFYFEGETKKFENIENEWPLFYILMIIDGVFRSDQEQVEEYQNLLRPRLSKDKFGDLLVPQYYYVSEDDIELEKQDPGSQTRFSSSEGETDDCIFLWGQALLIISQLLTSGLLHVNELDPIRRYLPSYNRPQRRGRYSAFQGIACDLVVQVVLVAESTRLQTMMATYGIQTQTPHEVDPVQIWAPSNLVKVYQRLGLNPTLGLKGRPARPIGALGTSKVYRIFGQTVLCHPLIFEDSDFYLSHDMSLLIDDIKNDLKFVGRYWRLSGRPTVCILIREEHMRDPRFKEMLDLFAMMKKGYCDDQKVRLGRLQNLISSSCVEHLDFINSGSKLDLDLDIKPFRQVVHDYAGFQSLTDIPKAFKFSTEGLENQNFANMQTGDLIEMLNHSSDLFTKAKMLGVLQKREGPQFSFQSQTVREHLLSLNRRAGLMRHWAALRYCSSLLCQLVDSISPYITTILVNGKQIGVGVIGHEEVVFEKPMIPAEIQDIVYRCVQPHDVIQAVLQQEVVLYCGKLIATQPDLFRGIFKIRTGWILHAIKLYLGMSSESPPPLESHCPSDIRRLLVKMLTMQDWAEQERLSYHQRRQLEGCLCRVPQFFHARVWNILEKTPGGFAIWEKTLPQQPTLTAMSISELNFAILVEDILHSIPREEYRQITVELFCVISTILRRNPELSFTEQLNVGALVGEAFKIFLKEIGSEKMDDMTSFFQSSYSTTTSYLARAVVNKLLKKKLFDNPKAICGPGDGSTGSSSEPCILS